jgi:hypothetical protein
VNRPKLSLRRPLAVLGAAFVGLAAAVAVAAPASAHHSIIEGTGCRLANGDVKVTWTVNNSESEWEGKITEVSTPSGTPITGIAVGATIPKSGEGSLTGEQTVPAGQDVKLTIEAVWDLGDSQHTDKRTGTATVTGDCAPASPSPSPSESESPSPSPSPSESESPSPTPSPSESESPAPSPTPSAPGEPVFALDVTCDELVFIIENPANGIAFTVTLTSEKGVVKQLKAVPGQTTSVSFDAYEGLEVTPSIGDITDEPVPWTEPADCDGEGGGLPVTGAAAGGMAAGALVLLALGAGLFLVARRRRIRFTA